MRYVFLSLALPMYSWGRFALRVRAFAQIKRRWQIGDANTT